MISSTRHASRGKHPCRVASRRSANGGGVRHLCRSGHTFLRTRENTVLRNQLLLALPMDSLDRRFGRWVLLGTPSACEPVTLD